MNHLHSLTLHNIVYFKETSRFEFKPGVTFVRGRNLQRRGANASNGAGKSLLMSTLANVLFDTHPIITKNTRSIQKQIYAKDSWVQLRFKTAKHRYEYKKAGASISLSRDGTDTKSRIPRDQLHQLLDLSEEEFFSTVYLDSRRTNSFQMGTSSERFAFATALFRLQDIDDFRKHINRTVNELNSDASLLDQSRRDRDECVRQLQAIDPKSGARAQRLETWLQTATRQAQSLAALEHGWANYNRYAHAMATLKRMGTQRVSRLIRADLDALAVYQEQVNQYKQAKITQREIEAKLRLIKIDDSEYDAWLKRKHQHISVAQPVKPVGNLEHARQLLAKIRLSQSRVQKMHDATQFEIKNVQAQLDRFEQRLAHERRCPTCHTTLDADAKESIVSGFNALLTTRRKRLKKIAQYLAAHQLIAAHEAYSAQLIEYKKSATESRALEQYDFEAALNYRRLTSGKRPLPDCPVPPHAFKGSELRSELERALELEQQRVLTNSLKTERPERKLVADEAQALAALVARRMSKLPALSAAALQRKTLLAQRKELDARILELERRAADLPVYQMLGDAYSVKGIKMLLVQRIATALEKNLNRYARQIFSEDFSFKFLVADGRFDCTVTRKSGKHQKVSDIRHLSGAESRLFVFLFVLALLPLIPDRRRMNTLILDEPEVGMDQDTFETFYTRLLPALQKIVPCLIIVTPRNDYQVPDARVVTVVKDCGVSRLVDGVVR